LQALEQPEQKPITMFMPTSAVPSEPVHEVKPRGERVRQQSFWDSSAPAQEPRLSSSAAPVDDYGGDGDDGEIINGDALEDDELYEKAVELVRRLDKASVSLLQRRLRIGYTRAARMIDVMEARGVVGPAKDGSSKPRDVLPQK
jgi:DNA segregation ATPase FtsK/SpoIIIE-like protein